MLPIEIGRNANGMPYACISDEDNKAILSCSDLDVLARDDGFQDAEEMVVWMSDAYGLPFNGFLHKWLPR